MKYLLFPIAKTILTIVLFLLEQTVVVFWAILYIWSFKPLFNIDSVLRIKISDRIIKVEKVKTGFIKTQKAVVFCDHWYLYFLPKFHYTAIGIFEEQDPYYFNDSWHD